MNDHEYMLQKFSVILSRLLLIPSDITPTFLWKLYPSTYLQRIDDSLRHC